MTPPGGILLLLCYGAGLVTGLSHFSLPLLLFSVLVWLLGWRCRVPGLAAAILLAGWLAAGLARQAEREACRTRLPVGTLKLTVRLLDDVGTAGGTFDARPTRAHCRGAVSVRWPRGLQARAGQEWQVEGRWIPGLERAGRRRGILRVRQGTLVGTGPAAMAGWRVSLSHSARRLYGSRSGLIEAVILNRREGLDPELRNTWAAAGLAHLLCISGLHVGILAGWLLLLARAVGVPPGRARLAAAVAGLLYASFLGWPAPATRAACFIALFVFCRWRQRAVQPAALLGVACLGVLLVDPYAVFSAGTWLSAAAVWGTTHFGRWSERALPQSRIARVLAVSSGATLATAPITAAAFGLVAPVGVLLNLVAIPLSAVAVPGVFASLLLRPAFPGLAAGLAGGSGLLLNLLEGLAVAGSRIPGGHVVQATGPGAAVPWILVLVCALWSTGRGMPGRLVLQRWVRMSAVAAWAGVFLALLPARPDGGSGLTLHFLRVGQGDAAVVRTPGGHWILVDAGPRTEAADAGRSIVGPFLARQGVRRLSVALVSHPHADHLGGMPAVLERIPADVVVEPADLTGDPLYLEFLRQITADGIPWHPGRDGDHFALDGVSFRLLHPDTTWAEWGDDLNEDSVVLLVRFGAFSALFAGDAGFRVEARLQGRVGPVDLLKVGHHGSRTATGDRWLDELRPRAAVISLGPNRYGHPSPATLARLARRAIPVWRTDRDGMVTVRTDGETMTIDSRRGRLALDVRP